MKEKKKESSWALCPWEGAVEKERFSHPGDPLHQLGDHPGQKGASEAQRRVQQLDCGRKSRERPVWRVRVDPLCSSAQDVHLLVHARAGCCNSGFRAQSLEEDWDWKCKDSLHGAGMWTKLQLGRGRGMCAGRSLGQPWKLHC